MKTLTLQRLMVSFEETRHYHIAAALLETDPDRQSCARRLAYRAAAVLDAIHFELLAREEGSGRTVVETRRADRYLQHLLEEFLDMREPTGGSPEPALAMGTSRPRLGHAAPAAIAFAGRSPPAPADDDAGGRVPGRSLVSLRERRRHA